MQRINFNFTKILTRDFIYQNLYAPKTGYFCKDSLQIGELSAPLSFKENFGFEDYQKQLIEKYPKNAWLTPSEIFKPYYGMAIANYISQYMQHIFDLKFKNKKFQSEGNKKKQQRPSLKIIEVGPGTGTNAECILDYFKQQNKMLYNNIEYNLVEISPVLCQRMRTKLGKNHSQLFLNNQINIINKDFLDFHFNKKSEVTFVLFLEVLDNLPHDRVYLKQKHETYVEDLKEIQVPIQDKYIKKVLNLYNRTPKQQLKGIQRLFNFFQRNVKNNIFLPTSCYQILEHVQQTIPNNHLIISDFDSLRPDYIQGINSPIVSFKGEESNQKQDYNTYLVPTGSADIFFPTDFALLQQMYKETCNKNSQVLKSYKFMKEFSNQEWTQGQSGYNPLKEDFGNTSFLLTKI